MPQLPPQPTPPTAVGLLAVNFHSFARGATTLITSQALAPADANATAAIAATATDAATAAADAIRDTAVVGSPPARLSAGSGGVSERGSERGGGQKLKYLHGRL